MNQDQRSKDRDQEIKKHEYLSKIKSTQDEMIVPIEIRIIASIPYTSVLILIFYIGQQAVDYELPGANALMLFALIIAILIHNTIRYFFHGVGLFHFLFGMALVDKETGYFITRYQVWELIKKELYYRFTLTGLKHMFVILESPYYQSIAMKDMNFIVGYRKQAVILKYLTQTMKKECS
jgi:hypothetical protein